MSSCKPKPSHTLKTQNIRPRKKGSNIEVAIIIVIIDAEIQTMLEQASNFVEINVRQPQERRAPTCKKCGAPMKGHKRGNCETTII